MKYVLVTGAYGGMGRKTVELLRERGFGVFALDRQVESSVPNVVPLEADVTDRESLCRAFEAISRITDELYAIIHFAGVYMMDSLVEMDERAFVRIFEINLFGVYRINQIFLPLLKRGSRIIITTSELAPLDPLPFTGIYAVTKGALDKYAYSLRMELQLLGIDVAVLRAGAVDTGMLGVSTAALERFCANTALYTCNAERFKQIVERVEARSVAPEKIAQRVVRMLRRKHLKFAYAINRNSLLILLNLLPKRLQLWIIRMVLK